MKRPDRADFFLYLAVGLLVAYLLGLALGWPGLWAAQHGDEGHYTRSARYLATQPTAEGLRTYPEMSGPLPFALYGVWGSLFGWELPTLRLLSLLVACASGLLLYSLLRRLHAPGWPAVLALAWLLLNPYWAGLSLYVYTDMLAVLFFLGSIYALVGGSFWGFVACAAGAALCRQYLVFWPVGVALWALIGGYRQWPYGCWALGAGLSLLPLALLMLWWGGSAPDSQVRTFYLQESLRFHASFFWLYVALLPLWLAPWALPQLLRAGNAGAWILSLALAQLYWVAPIGSGTAALAKGEQQVGLLDRLLLQLPPTGRDIIYVALLALGFRWLLILLGRIRLWGKRPDMRSLLVIAQLVFLVGMSFSYLCWEKYLLPVALLGLLMLLHRRTDTHGVEM